MINFYDKSVALTFDDLLIVPQYSTINSRSSVNIMSRLDDFKNLHVPLIASPMKSVCETSMAVMMGKLGGLGIVHRFMPVKEQAGMIRTVKDCGVYPAAAVGVTDDFQERIFSLVAAGAKLLCFDVAHGHNVLSETAIKWARDKYPDVHIMGGSVCTAQAVMDLESWGANSVRVGIGGGSACETRTRCGVGFPQASAIAECSAVSNLTIVADGGIRNTGDVAKAIALGADAVMIGNLFAGTDESPGPVMREGPWAKEVNYKVYFGSASYVAKMDEGRNDSHVEGTSMRVPYCGSVKNIVDDICDGLRSAMSYVGANNLAEFGERAKFVRMTQAGTVEASPHGLLRAL